MSPHTHKLVQLCGESQKHCAYARRMSVLFLILQTEIGLLNFENGYFAPSTFFRYFSFAVGTFMLVIAWHYTRRQAVMWKRRRQQWYELQRGLMLFDSAETFNKAMFYADQVNATFREMGCPELLRGP